MALLQIANLISTRLTICNSAAYRATQQRHLSDSDKVHYEKALAKELGQRTGRFRDNDLTRPPDLVKQAQRAVDGMLERLERTQHPARFRSAENALERERDRDFGR